MQAVLACVAYSLYDYWDMIDMARELKDGHSSLFQAPAKQEAAASESTSSAEQSQKRSKTRKRKAA